MEISGEYHLSDIRAKNKVKNQTASEFRVVDAEAIMRNGNLIIPVPPMLQDEI